MDQVGLVRHLYPAITDSVCWATGKTRRLKSTTQRLACERIGPSTGKAENFILNESVLLKSVAQRKPSHAVSLMLVVFICLIYCYSSMLYPLCIEVNDSIQPKAIGIQAPYSFTKKQSSYPSWASIHIGAARLTGGGNSCSTPLGLEGPLTLTEGLQLQQLIPHTKLGGRVTRILY